MLAKMQMILETSEEKTMPVQNAIILQSILMSQINRDYAETMHISGLHPYSQCIEVQNGKTIWNINTTSKEAFEQIIKPLNEPEFQDFFIRQKQLGVRIKEKTVSTISKTEWLELCERKQEVLSIELSFITPTAFRSQSQYIFFPKIHLIYQSLLNKYATAFEMENMKSEEILEQLVESTRILQYNLKSCGYAMKSVKIPAFTGKLTLQIKGTQTLINTAYRLFQFGDYSGVGIKTAMGMGRMRVM